MERNDPVTSLTPGMSVGSTPIPGDDPEIQAGAVRVGNETYAPGSGHFDQISSNGDQNEANQYGALSPSIGDASSQYSAANNIDTNQPMGKQLGSTLDTQGSIVFGELGRQNLEEHLARLDEQIRAAQKQRDNLQSIIADAPPAPDFGTMTELETEYTEQLNEMRQKVRDLFNQVADSSQENAKLLEEVLASRSRVTDGITQLFGAIDQEQTQVEEEIAKLQAEIDTIRGNQELADSKGRLKTELDQIKHDRCIFFGCIDLHPPELYNIN